MNFFRWLHTIYGVIVFSILFVFFFFLLLIPICFPKQFKLVGVFNRWWARALALLVFLPCRVEYRARLNPGKQYIFCPNHFSYMDIPTLGLNRHNTIFVGKSDMNNVPVFGFMYRRLHITVDRSKMRSRYTTMKQTMEALDAGKSLVIFPEGGIVTEKDPVMASFKDGAFRASIEKQIPIVPVTIPYNWIILPPDRFLLHWHRLKVIFHEPIDPAGMTLADIGLLKDRTRSIIETELKKHNV
jgi:1-acyl-sn-glycerol-3-phosphate acyltransferase